MANPQKENGYTPIANEIMDKLAKSPIRSEVRRVIDFILRKTYGFNKKADIISLSQFVEGTEMKKSCVCRALKEGVANKLILKGENGYSFNKNTDEWGVAKRLMGSRTANLGVANKLIKGVADKLPTIIDNYKNNITKDIGDQKIAFASFWELYPNKKSKKQAAVAWAKLTKDEQEAALASLPAHIKQEQWVKDDGRFIPHPTTWLNQRRWEDVLTSPKDDKLINPLTWEEYENSLRQQSVG